MNARTHSLQRSIPRDHRPAPAKFKARQFVADLLALIVILTPVLIFMIVTS